MLKEDSKKILFIAVVDALASNVSINFLTDGFRITLSVIILPIILYFYRRLNPIVVSTTVGIVGMIFRTLINISQEGELVAAFLADYQVIAFDISYGILFYLLFYKKEEKTLNNWFIAIWISDFLSNIAEVILRYIDGDVFEITNTIFPLMSVTFTRSIIAIIILMAIKYYKLFIKKEEHDSRYRWLLTLTSDLKSETYFMKKNMDYIEFVMSNAYMLYENIVDDDLSDEYKKLSLSIAKDVHEIKKNYMRVVKGFEHITGEGEEYSRMKLGDIIDILKINTAHMLQADKLNIEVNFRHEGDFYLEKHYFIMSILRNLINNAIEARREGIKGEIEVIHKDRGEKHIFIVKDNGKGIRRRDLDYIFDPGFSTKFSKRTGDLNRGLGLTLVKNIIEDEFKGIINVYTEEDAGTEFYIEIPKEELNVSEQILFD